MAVKTQSIKEDLSVPYNYLRGIVSNKQRADQDDIPMITRFNTEKNGLNNRMDWQTQAPILGKDGFSNRV